MRWSRRHDEDLLVASPLFSPACYCGSGSAPEVRRSERHSETAPRRIHPERYQHRPCRVRDALRQGVPGSDGGHSPGVLQRHRVPLLQPEERRLGSHSVRKSGSDSRPAVYRRTVEDCRGAGGQGPVKAAATRQKGRVQNARPARALLFSGARARRPCYDSAAWSMARVYATL